MSISSLIHFPEQLKKAITNIYLPANLNIKNPIIEEDIRAQEYSACRFELNNKKVAFRVAKTTPTKIGQFVTVWKRNGSNNVIEPFSNEDNINFVIIHVADSNHQGQFIFDSDILISQGIMANKDKQGKLAFRIYPPWSKPVAKAAIQAQRWQINCFYSIDQNGSADLERVKKLFKIEAKNHFI